MTQRHQLLLPNLTQTLGKDAVMVTKIQSAGVILFLDRVSETNNFIWRKAERGKGNEMH